MAIIKEVIKESDATFDDIMKNIVLINTNRELLEDSLNQIIRKSYNKDLKEKIKRIQHRTNRTIQSTSGNLAQIEATNKENEHNLARLNKITENFADAVEKYVNVQKSIVLETEMALENVKQNNQIEEFSIEENSLLVHEERVTEFRKYVLNVDTIMSNVNREQKPAASTSSSVINDRTTTHNMDEALVLTDRYKHEILNLIQLQVEASYRRKLFLMYGCAAVVIVLIFLNIVIAFV